MRNNAKKRGRIPVIGDMLFSLLTLPVAMGYIQEFFTNPENPEILVYAEGTFLLMGIARLFRAFRYRDQSRLQFIKFLIYGVLMIAGCFSAAFLDKTACERLLMTIYLGSLFADRVISCIQNHGARNLVLNLIAIWLIGSALVEMYGKTEYLFAMMIAVVMHSLVSILAVSFARINLKTLANVARETYAAEIIGGLLLLIFAFSYILKFLEPGLESMKDALWYCFAIVTTIGFGDVTATSTVGRLLSVILGMYGIIVVALITSIIVNYYGEMKRENAQEGWESKKEDST